MKTLYISDLDGTLLDATPHTSEYTNKVIKALHDSDIIFSFATARSYTTTKQVTKGLSMKYPAVVHNGTFIVDTFGKIITKNTFSKEDSDFIIDTLLELEINPIVYSLINDKEQFSFIRSKLNKETLAFLAMRENDPRKREIFANENFYDGEVYYFTLIGDEEKTEPLYHKLKDSFQCYFQRDLYSGDYWLEILPKGATKANAVKQLASMLGCEKIVAFGDGINDVEMFSIADECYAVENAEDVLKEKSTDIIGKNTDDAVAKWLENNLHFDACNF